MLNDELKQFCDTFDLIDNALQMRTLKRWNGRDLTKSENLAEHTHLVVCAVYKLYNEIYDHRFTLLSIENVVKAALYHDALELLRGDILSITKDKIPGLRMYTDNEEEHFMLSQNINLSSEEASLLKLADLYACNKFVQYCLTKPSNDFTKRVYNETLEKYKEAYEAHLRLYCYCTPDKSPEIDTRFVKGYKDDAGTDIILNKPITFMPMSTTTVDLDIQITPNESEMAFLCARTSAANKGLSVATCPIDPHFSGNVSAIVHNVSNNIITYEAGESFCQYVTCKIITDKTSKCKKEGERTDSKLGGTDVSNT